MHENLFEPLPADYTIFTDGHATDGVEDRGAGAVIFRGETKLRRIRTPAGRWTSSYRAEMTTLESALVFLQEAAADSAPRKVRIFTDSQ